MKSFTLNSACVFAGVVLFSSVAGNRLQTQIPERVLGARTAEGSEQLSQVRGFRELSDGRVIVTDQTERKIVMFDFTRRTTTHLGREGDGPGEYGSATDLLPTANDTTLLSDARRSLNAYTIITPDGKLGNTITLPDSIAISYVYDVDRSGRIYLPKTIYASGPQQSGADSTPLLRVDLRRGRVDTATFLRVAKRGAPGVLPNPYNQRDQWAVAPDGSIAIVNVDNYSVTWIAPDGRRKIGAPIPYDRIPVTQKDQDEFRSLARRVQGIGVSSGGSGTPPAPTQNSGFPANKPPFFGNDAVHVAPNGELWVRRAQPLTDSRPLHDIINSEGRRIATIRLPAETKLLELGAHGIYLARWDQDDLIHIERYAYPR
jgi:hypothetical protein